MVKIQDGAGQGNAARVDSSNRLSTFAVTETESRKAVELGDGYNINTGIINLTGESAVFYLKNNDTRPLEVEFIAVGLGIASVGDTPRVTVIRNPTAGTIVTGASGVAININRNFGVSKELVADAYKGQDLATFTNGDDLGIFFANDDARFQTTINIDILPGNSIGIKIDPQLSSGDINVYAVLVCYLDPEVV